MSEVKTTEVATKQELPAWMSALDRAKPKFLAIVGKEEQSRIELGFAFQLIEKNDNLKKCTPDSIVNAVINVARVGTTLNPILKLAHLIPRDGKCVLDFDYKGLIKVLKDNRCLKDIQAIIVYEDEEFKEGVGQLMPPTHTKIYAKSVNEQKLREYKGVYCQVLLMDNTVIYTPFMPYWEILKTETYSKSGGAYSAWNRDKWREEMIKKTKIKRDFKTLISGEPTEQVISALQIEEENHGLNYTTTSQQGKGISKMMASVDEAPPLAVEDAKISEQIVEPPQKESESGQIEMQLEEKHKAKKK